MPSLRQWEVLERQWVSPNLKPKCPSLDSWVQVIELKMGGQLKQGHGTKSSHQDKRLQGDARPCTGARSAPPDCLQHGAQRPQLGGR